MKILWFIVFSTLSLMAGCASTHNITPEYVSPNIYDSYKCPELATEYNRISTYIETAKKRKFNLSATGMSIGMYGNRNGVYPTVSFGVGKSQDKQVRDEKLSRLFGERDAIVQSGRIKQCNFVNDLKVSGE